jgi:hypothetical protein
MYSASTASAFAHDKHSHAVSLSRLLTELTIGADVDYRKVKTTADFELNSLLGYFVLKIYYADSL